MAARRTPWAIYSARPLTFDLHAGWPCTWMAQSPTTGAFRQSVKLTYALIQGCSSRKEGQCPIELTLGSPLTAICRRAALAQRYVRSQKFTERLSSYRDDLLILIHEVTGTSS